MPAARLLRPALRLVERLLPWAFAWASAGLVLKARSPGYAIVATAFLVVSFALALFAESYRLDAGAR